MKNLLQLAKQVWSTGLPHNGIYVDFLLGSGFDSMYLAKFADEGRIYSFGKGSEIDYSCKLFETNSVDNVRLINDSPQNYQVYVDSYIDGGICNIHNECKLPPVNLILGLETALLKLKTGGRILLINCNEDYAVVNEFISGLDKAQYMVYSFNCISEIDSPIFLLLEKQ